MNTRFSINVSSLSSSSSLAWNTEISKAACSDPNSEKHTTTYLVIYLNEKNGKNDEMRKMGKNLWSLCQPDPTPCLAELPSSTRNFILNLSIIKISKLTPHLLRALPRWALPRAVLRWALPRALPRCALRWAVLSALSGRLLQRVLRGRILYRGLIILQTED